MINSGQLVGGRYKIEEHIGSGGMQHVYRALDTKLDILVALKTPQETQKDQKFKNSAIIAARVNHHNVAKTLDYFEDSGEAYLIEELVDGGTLEDKASLYEYFDPHMSAKVFHLLAKGVQASHLQGVIHRDLKPSNIMVTKGVGVTGLKITDFGIATFTEQVFSEEARSGDMTRSTSGTVRGALPFMAPEMMFRKPNIDLTEAIDIWSIGAMMFKLMTGDFPFGVYLEAAVNVSTKNRQPWPLFMTSNPQFSALSKELQGLVDRCLEYDPSKRPTSTELVSACQDLCYQSGDRYEGRITRTFQSGYSFFAKGGDHDVYVSKSSIYGNSRLEVDSVVLYSKYPGQPNQRAHPVVKLKDRPIEF
ncbi:Serine/threonine-protein kinase PK-1 [Marinomonas spartinae]|uniref:Serine/threonine-protein kinase PK-1 n=1 Tax=Marinomonas spartinae TaxID=1792290 RepID=A0A1A8TSA6_9GAMM|nr:serine/threonine-protein kinase [Marinomonas spartinae]SBS37112.1 Serine/threonine-protein kinase PK-1 [Marinomonas spartinae]